MTSRSTPIKPVHAARHLLRAKDLIDARYAIRSTWPTPHQYLLTRRLERAAELLRNTDR